MDWTPVYVGASVVANWLILYIWQPWGKGYAEEKGKNFARKEDLNEILAEVRAVTITQKEIEAKLSGEQWDRQIRWNQKRDLYVNLLQNAQDLAQAFGEMPGVLKMQVDPRPEFREEGQKNFTKCLIRLNESLVQFSRNVMLSHIFAMPECFATLTGFLKTRTAANPPDEKWATLEAGRCNALVSSLAMMAKKDLGLE
jgi:hypothetical protein